MPHAWEVPPAAGTAPVSNSPVIRWVKAVQGEAAAALLVGCLLVSE